MTMDPTTATADELRDSLHIDSLRGIFDVKIAQGMSPINAYEYALLTHVEIAEAVASEIANDLTLIEARRQIMNAVYVATSLIETWQHQGFIIGNGHHVRQEAAALVGNLVESRWQTT